MNALIIVAEYGDKSGFILLRSYPEIDKKLAEGDIDMLHKADPGGNMIYKIISVPFIQHLISEP